MSCCSSHMAGNIALTKVKRNNESLKGFLLIVSLRSDGRSAADNKLCAFYPLPVEYTKLIDKGNETT